MDSMDKQNEWDPNLFLVKCMPMEAGSMLPKLLAMVRGKQNDSPVIDPFFPEPMNETLKCPI